MKKDNRELYTLSVKLEFVDLIDATSYEEAAEICKDNFKESYGIDLKDREISKFN